MGQSRLTATERAWVEKLQTVLNECPSGRIGFFTIGDPDVSLYDTKKQDKIDALMDRNARMDFGNAVDDNGARFGTITFPSQVHSTAG